MDEICGRIASLIVPSLWVLPGEKAVPIVGVTELAQAARARLDRRPGVVIPEEVVVDGHPASRGGSASRRTAAGCSGTTSASRTTTCTACSHRAATGGIAA